MSEQRAEGFWWVRWRQPEPLGLGRWQVVEVDGEHAIFGDVYIEATEPDIEWGPYLGKAPASARPVVLLGDAHFEDPAEPPVAALRRLADQHERLRVTVQAYLDRGLIEPDAFTLRKWWLALGGSNLRPTPNIEALSVLTRGLMEGRCPECHSPRVDEQDGAGECLRCGAQFVREVKP